MTAPIRPQNQPDSLPTKVSELYRNAQANGTWSCVTLLEIVHLIERHRNLPQTEAVRLAIRLLGELRKA